eukprot:7904348-Alexandrium_andersonii.AAC.1
MHPDPAFNELRSALCAPAWRIKRIKSKAAKPDKVTASMLQFDMKEVSMTVQAVAKRSAYLLAHVYIASTVLGYQWFPFVVVPVP